MSEACPSCEREFDTEHGMKVHHKSKHGESLAKVEKRCENCGDTFEVFQSRADNGRGKYCSTNCRYEGDRADVECAWCGKEMQIQRHRYERFDKFYCSDECEAEWKAENVVGEKHHQYDRVEVECYICGESIEMHPCRLEYTEKFLCSDECFSKFQSERFSGANSPHWKGGPVGHYGSGWHKKREKKIKQDGEKCVGCGMTREEHKRKYGQDLEVHHVQPVRKFENLERAHELENLETYCIKCHRKWEGIPLNPVKA